jgi:hypothetical protein
MDEIWQQFHRLPRVIRDIAAKPVALTAIEELEGLYPQLDLASLVMRVMVKQVPVDQVATVLQQEHAMAAADAENVAARLRSDIWNSAATYLGLPEPSAAAQPMPTPTPMAQNVPPLAADPAPAVVEPPQPPAIPTIAPRTPMGPLAPAPSLAQEDDDELAHHAARVRQLQTQTGTEDYSAVARDILAEHQLAFGEDLLQKRAESVIKSQLKGMRDEEATREVLQRDPKVGGLGLDADQARLVAHSAAGMVERMKTEGRISATPMPMPPDISELPQAMTQKPQAMPPLRRDFPQDDQPTVLPNVTEAPRPSRPIIRPADIPPPPPPEPAMNIPPAPAPKPVAVVRPQRIQDRPSISDITAPSSTLGPAEEMHEMTLTQFRRMGQGANDITAKMLQKFKNLQNESFALWSEAVRGWRTGEVYSLYLAMGRESLEQGIPITHVIEQRAAKKVAYLSEHEFNALADLNRKLQL